VDRPEPLTVEVERIDAPSVAVVRVHGELDLGSSPRLTAILAGIMADAPATGRNVIFDLSGLHFCDSSGLAALIATYKSATAGGGRTYVAGATPTVLTSMRVMTLDRLFLMRDTVDAALAEMAPA
jgi:anti-sigma B factor antagonist